jgi:DNA mismatch endonuclease, patch repair protein
MAFWNSRIGGNRERDARVNRALRRDGWLVLRVWECALTKERTIEKIRAAINERRAAMIA